MLSGRWTNSHRCSWITVYVSCCNAQLNLIVDTMTCTCIVMLLSTCQLPSCNLFTQHLLLVWRVTTSVDSSEPHPSVIIIAFPSTTSINYFLLPLLSYYCYFHITPVTSASPGAAELTTLLLRLISILWLPLCRINKFGFYFPRKLL